MNKTEIRSSIYNCIQNSNLISIEYNEEYYHITGIPIMMGRQFLLIVIENDYLLDGYEILKMKDIKSIQTGETQKFGDMILREKNLIDEDILRYGLEISSWVNLMKDINSDAQIIALSLYEEGHEEKNYFVGEIVDIVKDYVVFKEIDTCGRWHSNTINIDYKDIVCIELKSRYLSILFEYQKMPQRDK